MSDTPLSQGDSGSTENGLWCGPPDLGPIVKVPQPTFSTTSSTPSESGVAGVVLTGVFDRGSAPGPDWSHTARSFYQPVILHDLGALLPGHSVTDAGGFIGSDGVNFDLTAGIIAANSWEFTCNIGGDVRFLYTGPAVNCRLTLTVYVTGTSVTDPSQGNGVYNEVALNQDGVAKVQVGGAALDHITPGTTVYNFSLAAGVNSVIQVVLQNAASGPVGSIRMVGTFDNVW